MRELMPQDTINGKKGSAFAKIGGNNEEMFFAKTIEATLELLKAEVKSVGRMMVGHKVTGMSGSGSMTLYYLSPMFRTLVSDYKNTGANMSFDMVIENDDNESGAGKQVVMLTGVLLDSVTLAKLDGDADDALEEDVDFTFDGFEVLSQFNKI